MQPQYVQGGGQPQYGQPQYYAQQPQQYAGQPPYAAPAYAASAPPGAYGYAQQQPQQVIVMQQQQQPEVVVIETQQTMNMGGFGRMGPAMCVCPNCRATVSTNVNSEPGAQTWFCFCILLFLFWPAACLPFCIPSCQDVTHSCPACGVVVTRISG